MVPATAGGIGEDSGTESLAAGIGYLWLRKRLGPLLREANVSTCGLRRRTVELHPAARARVSSGQELLGAGPA